MELVFDTDELAKLGGLGISVLWGLLLRRDWHSGIVNWSSDGEVLGNIQLSRLDHVFFYPFFCFNDSWFVRFVSFINRVDGVRVS